MDGWMDGEEEEAAAEKEEEQREKKKKENKPLGVSTFLFFIFYFLKYKF